MHTMSIINELTLPFLPTGSMATNDPSHFIVYEESQKWWLLNISNNKINKIDCDKYPQTLTANNSFHFGKNSLPRSTFVYIVESKFLFLINAKTDFKTDTEIIIKQFDIQNDLILIVEKKFKIDCDLNRADFSLSCYKIYGDYDYIICNYSDNSDTCTSNNVCHFNIRTMHLKIFDNYNVNSVCINQNWRNKCLQDINYIILIHCTENHILLYDLETDKSIKYICDTKKINFERIHSPEDGKIIHFYRIYLINDGIIKMLTIKPNIKTIENKFEQNNKIKFSVEHCLENNNMIKIIATQNYDEYEQIIKNFNQAYIIDTSMLGDILVDTFNNNKYKYNYTIDDDNNSIELNINVTFYRDIQLHFVLNKTPQDEINIIKKRLEYLENNLLKKKLN